MCERVGVLGASGDIGAEARTARRRRLADEALATPQVMLGAGLAEDTVVYSAGGEMERSAGRRQRKMLIVVVVSAAMAAALAPDPGLRQWQVVNFSDGGQKLGHLRHACLSRL
jgi:hypothetical protein